MADDSNPSAGTTAPKRRFSFTVKAVAGVCALLLLANVGLGAAMLGQSRAVMRTLIDERMLDISNTAADMLDGDELETLTADDAGTDKYRRAAHVLSIFYENIDLEYIYGVKQVGEKEYVFTIDSDPDAPGDFGEPVVYTEALEAAGNGTAGVDAEPYSDAWGRFYSAYSPVFDSAGEVAGIVAVDFDADWYEDQIAAHARIAIATSVVSLALGAAIVLLFTGRMRRRFRALSHELSDLAVDVEDLTREVAGEPGGDGAVAAEARSADEIDALAQKIRAMQSELRGSIERVREQAYADALTGLGNRAAYDDAVNALVEKIDAGEAAFSVAILDINGLKQANDEHGHDAGDLLITDTAAALREAFGGDRAFREGGDEFVVLFEGEGPSDVEARFAAFDRAVEQVNAREDRARLPLSVSKGFATFVAEDGGYRPVFRRADEAMYADKAAYYKTHDRRVR